MRPTRTLNLRREALTELTPAQLTGVAAGNQEDGTRGGICTGIMVATAVITAVTEVLQTMQTGAPADRQA